MFLPSYVAHRSAAGPHSQQSVSVARSNSMTRSQRPPPSGRPTSAPQASPRVRYYTDSEILLANMHEHLADNFPVVVL